MRLHMFVCVGACVSARERMYVCVCVSVCADVRIRVRLRMCVRVRACSTCPERVCAVVGYVMCT